MDLVNLVGSSATTQQQQHNNSNNRSNSNKPTQQKHNTTAQQKHQRGYTRKCGGGLSLVCRLSLSCSISLLIAPLSHWLSCHALLQQQQTSNTTQVAAAADSQQQRSYRLQVSAAAAVPSPLSPLSLSISLSTSLPRRSLTLSWWSHSCAAAPWAFYLFDCDGRRRVLVECGSELI